ncbi:MAG: serine/threonine-protein phosphatase [Oscillospiraceae bacterium]|jgi:hypothetical protein|nr:serine/threonine-protein phosphatase [Oscillospiraceae bacterium]
MNFYEDMVCQEKKTDYLVCGDWTLCERTAGGTTFVLCDGIGSGVYANIAAIACAERLMELARTGMSLRAACETVAASMHRARKEDIPFSAFSAALILPDGQFAVYTYEAPEAILLQNGTASVLKPRFYTAGYEVIGEVTGTLYSGNTLLLSSDGVTQAGLGYGRGMGIGIEGVAGFINRSRATQEDIHELPRKIVDMCADLCAGRHEDDTTLALVHCREARELTVLTGPPAKPSEDKSCVRDFMSAAGLKVICGSTTTDIVARVLGEKVEMLKLNKGLGAPPEYAIEGIDLVTEGAIMLSQVYNILDEPQELFVENSAVERFCVMLREADVIRLMIGNAANDAHESLLFKQVGVRVRRTIVRLIADRLRQKGKLVLEKYY